MKRCRPKSAVIIGAGVVGLSVAKALKSSQEFENLDITVVADAFFSQTTSYGSGGYWMPYAIQGTPEKQIENWGKLSYDFYLELMNSSDAARVGASMIQSYQLYETKESLHIPEWKDSVIGFKELNADDIAELHLPSTKYRAGYTFTTVVVDQKYYLKYLMDELKKLGVSFKQQKVHSLTELLSVISADIVINCCGLHGDMFANNRSNSNHTTGSRDAAVCEQQQDDQDSFPIRGQVLRVKAPWIRSVWGFGTSYIIPNIDNVVLGGTAQKGDWNTNVSLADSERILEDIYELFPSLKDAQLVSTSEAECVLLCSSLFAFCI
jgi:D-amino-acid oxidase